jgi:polyphosphate kinase 2
MTAKFTKKLYEQELERLQLELIDLQDVVRETGMRVAVLMEGRDAAGKGGIIKRITEHLNPRHYRVVALGVPDERERGQWYLQRYVERLPAAGEICLFDRSWYNRAGVERVMGFCSEDDVERFFREVPALERMLVGSGLILRKYWLEVSAATQEARFRERAEDPAKRWKLSPIDLEARKRYDDYSRARDDMFAHTDTAESPWFVVDAEDQRRARLNCIAHLLVSIPHGQPKRTKPSFPKLKRLGRDAPPPPSVARVPELW